MGLWFVLFLNEPSPLAAVAPKSPTILGQKQKEKPVEGLAAALTPLTNTVLDLLINLINMPECLLTVQTAIITFV